MTYKATKTMIADLLHRNKVEIDSLVEDIRKWNTDIVNALNRIGALRREREGLQKVYDEAEE
jgi:hypothetical protein